MSAGLQPRADEPNPVLSPQQQAEAMRRLQARVVLAMRTHEQKSSELQAASEDLQHAAAALLKATAHAIKLAKYPRRDARVRQAGD